MPSSAFALGGPIRHYVAVIGGTATFDDCTIESEAEQALLVENATAHLRGCIVRSSNQVFTARGLVANDANIIATNCEFYGSQLSIGFQAPGEGIRMARTKFHGGGLLVRGGQAGIATTGSNAITASQGEVWISDSAIEAGGSSCPITKSGSVPVFSRCTVVAQAFGCQIASTNETLLGAQQQQPVTVGGALQVYFRTDPGGVIAILAAPKLGVLQLPEVDQPIWLDAGTAFPVTFGFADPFGVAQWSALIPNAPAVLDQSIWIQAVGVLPTSPTLIASPVVGGVAR